MLQSIYIHLRKRIPSVFVRKVKKNRFLISIIRYIQPHGLKTYYMGGFLSGLQMRVPEQWAYSWTWGEWEVGVGELLEEYVQPGWTVMDVGAHIGYYTLLLAKLVGPGGRVIAFEPLPENQQLLHANISLNHYEERVDIVAAAVTERTQLIRLFRSIDSSRASVLKSNHQIKETQGNYVVIPSCKLDDYFLLSEFRKIDLIKMDIEAAESLAIEGMVTLLETHHPIMIIECHGESARKGLEILRNLGYRLHLVGDRDEELSSLFDRKLGHEDWLALP